MKLKRLLDSFGFYDAKDGDVPYKTLGILHRGDLIVVIRSFEDENFCLFRLGLGWIVQSAVTMQNIK